MADVSGSPWNENAPSERQVRHAAFLAGVIRLAQEFETAYRPRRTATPADRELLHLVAYGLLIRSVEVCEGMRLLRESPVQSALLRILAEAFVNLQFIECEPGKRADRARNFHDFWDVNRLKFLREVGRRFPGLLEQASTSDADLKAKLDPHRDRFCHKRGDGSEYWDWERLDLVSRVEAAAKALGTDVSDPERHTRIVALYQETNPYVHSGFRSLMASLVPGTGVEAMRPRVVAQDEPINASLIASALLLDLLAVCTRVFDCSDFDARIEALSKECIAAQ